MNYKMADLVFRTCTNTSNSDNVSFCYGCSNTMLIIAIVPRNVAKSCHFPSAENKLSNIIESLGC